MASYPPDPLGDAGAGKQKTRSGGAVAGLKSCWNLQLMRVQARGTPSPQRKRQHQVHMPLRKLRVGKLITLSRDVGNILTIAAGGETFSGGNVDAQTVCRNAR